MEIISDVISILKFIKSLITTKSIDLISFNEAFNLSETIGQTSDWLKTINLISVGFTELYFGKFDLVRYAIGCLHFIIMNISISISILIFSNDWLFSLIDNEFFPEKSQLMILFIIFLLMIAISIQFDYLLAEWNGTASVLNVFYYLQEDIKSKHRLTRSNHMKLSILTKVLYLINVKILPPLLTTIGCLASLLIAIMSKRILIVFTLGIPFLFYIIWITVSTVSIAAYVGIVIMYYYNLIYKQINYEFDLIEQQSSNWFMTMKNRRKLIWLINYHNSIAVRINMINLVTRRTILVFFIAVSLGLIIPMNYFIKSNDHLEKLIFFGIILAFLFYGICFAYVLSSLIRVAHKPYKTIYKILRKHNFAIYSKRNFQFKWKVINSF